MNLKQLIGEHTIDVELLPEEPLVLDVGCRYFNFCEEILALRPKAKIIALDPATDVARPSDKRIDFYNCALVASGRAWMRPNDWVVKENPQEGLMEVNTVTIEDLWRAWRYFDLVKLDCEGSEFQILENWPHKWGTQINVEFHDNLASPGLSGDYFERLFREKLPDYCVIQNPVDKLGIHTDCLLTLMPN